MVNGGAVLAEEEDFPAAVTTKVARRTKKGAA
jgi:hypothetical protein